MDKLLFLVLVFIAALASAAPPKWEPVHLGSSGTLAFIDRANLRRENDGLFIVWKEEHYPKGTEAYDIRIAHYRDLDPKSLPGSMKFLYAINCQARAMATRQMLIINSKGKTLLSIPQDGPFDPVPPGSPDSAMLEKVCLGPEQR